MSTVDDIRHISFSDIATDISNENFVGNCDNITFGILNGKPFDTSVDSFKLKDKIRWAESNAMFFEYLSTKLKLYAEALRKSNDKSKT